MAFDENNEVSFGKWRRRFWPIHSFELWKFIPLLLMKFCVSFIYSVLHATKDTLIVTAKGSGAEAIPILKGWFVILFATIFMLVYSKLSNRLSRKNLFYATIFPFLIFFFLYGFVLYPNREWLLPHESADWLVSMIGEKRAHWVLVYRYWMDSLFFLMAELWGGVVIALLFWGFANQINNFKEASRFYTIITAGGHVGVIAAGPLIWYYANTFRHSEYQFTIQYLMGLVSIVCLLFIGVYWWMNRNRMSSNERKQHEAATKLSLRESIRHIVNSPSLRYIALMVIGYSLSVNMIEVLWKATLKVRYPNPNEYQAFMGIISSIVGVSSFLLAVFVSGNIIRKFGWHLAAISTPVILGVTSAAFLGVFLVGYYASGSLLMIGSSSLFLLVIIGGIHGVACKSMKYCLFDPTKEMAFISLDEESKVKGKAAVDVVVSRFGKSGSSWIQIGLMEFLGVSSVLNIAPYLAPCILLAVFGWVVSVHFLKNQLKPQLELQTVK